MSSQLKGYEKAGRAFKLIGWVMIILTTLFAIVALPSFVRTHRTAFLGFSLVIVWMINGLTIFLGQSILKHKEWARVAGMILSALQLLAFPVGTLIGAYVLYHLFKGWNDESSPAG